MLKVQKIPEILKLLKSHQGAINRLGRAVWICPKRNPFLRRIGWFRGTKDRQNVCTTFLNGESVTFKILWGSLRGVLWLPETRISPSLSDVWWSNHFPHWASGVHIQDKDVDTMFAALFSEVKQRHSKSFGDRLEGYSGYSK